MIHLAAKSLKSCKLLLSKRELKFCYSLKQTKKALLSYCSSTDGITPIDSRQVNTPQSTESISKQSLSKKRRKIRQHTNPLQAQNRIPINLEPYYFKKNYLNPVHPFIIDVGCSKGRWTLKMAKEEPNLNFLGLEIRTSALEIALERIQKETPPLTNLSYLKSNGNIDILHILQCLHQLPSKVECISINFPDPHYKKKHIKRRLVNEQFVEDLAKVLLPETNVYIQTDVLELMEYMVFFFNESPFFTVKEGYSLEKYELNPSAFSVPTERQVSVLNKGLPVYRILFTRNHMQYLFKDES